MLHAAQSDPGDPQGGLPAAAIKDQAARILGSAAFQKSKRLSRFLNYAVTNTLHGNASALKETVLGLEVFDRGSSFDPRMDPIVRIDARRLRARVSEYYQAEGASDPIVIEFAPGSYVPRFFPSSESREARSPDHPKVLHTPKVVGRLVALDLMRLAQQQLETFTPEGVIRSESLFERAIAANPEQVRAHLGFGLSSVWKSILLCDTSHAAMERARAAALRALELDAAQGEAHGLMGFVQSAYDFDFQAANASFLLARRLNPSSIRLRVGRALFFLAPMGMLREAIDEMRSLEKQEPAQVRNIFAVGWLLYLARDYTNAAETLERALAIHPLYLQARYALALACEALGQYQRSDELLLTEEMCSTSPLMPLRREALRATRQGDRDRAWDAACRMETQYSPGSIDPVAIAGTFACLQDQERAMQWLERAYEDRRYWLIYLKSDPAFDALRGDPRFCQLLERMRLAGPDRT